MTTPIFESDWGADEELLLLEGIEMYGLGNWAEAAEHVGSKSKQQCEEHYNSVYLGGATAPLPDLSRALPKKKDASSSSQSSKGDKSTSSSSASSSSAGGITGAEAAAKDKPKPPKSGLANLVGYMPERGDFETEYENDAEMIVADMDFRDEVG